VSEQLTSGAAVQELRSHCGMLVRTHNELVEQRRRLMAAAGYSLPPESPTAPSPSKPPACEGGGSAGAPTSDGCMAMPQTPKHEPLPASAADLPALQLSTASPANEVAPPPLSVLETHG
jgi:hypothetical protein